MSFDADWREIYVGYARRDTFTGECPNPVPGAVRVTVRYQARDRPENAAISAAKWYFQRMMQQ